MARYLPRFISDLSSFFSPSHTPWSAVSWFSYAPLYCGREVVAASRMVDFDMPACVLLSSFRAIAYSRAGASIPPFSHGILSLT